MTIPTAAPGKMTLIAIAGAMEMMHRLRLEQPKPRYDENDALAVCSLAPMAELLFSGGAPDGTAYLPPKLRAEFAADDRAALLVDLASLLAARPPPPAMTVRAVKPDAEATDAGQLDEAA